MSRDDVGPLRRFLQGPDAASSGRSAAVRDLERRAADQTVDLYARDALVALQDFASSFGSNDPDRGREVGVRLLQYWEQLGMDELDWSGSDRGDAERILAAVAEIAHEPGDGPRTDPISRASRLAAGRRPLRENADTIRNRTIAESGEPSQDEGTPDDRLRRSLARMATARVIRDVVDLPTTTRGSEPVRQAAQQAVDEALRLGDRQRDLERANDSVGRAERHVDDARWNFAKVGLVSGAGSGFLAGFSDSTIVGATIRGAAFAYCAYRFVGVYQLEGELRTSRESLDTRRGEVVDQRAGLDQAVDAAASVTAPRRQQTSRRDGTDNGRRGRDGR